MKRSPSSVARYRLLLLLALIAVIVGLVMIIGELIPLTIAYEGPSATVEFDSVWDVVGLAIIVIAIIVVVWMRLKHKEALARILAESGRPPTHREGGQSDDDSSETPKQE